MKSTIAITIVIFVSILSVYQYISHIPNTYIIYFCFYPWVLPPLVVSPLDLAPRKIIEKRRYIPTINYIFKMHIKLIIMHQHKVQQSDGSILSNLTLLWLQRGSIHMLKLILKISWSSCCSSSFHFHGSDAT